MNISALGVANFVNSTAVGNASSEINGSKIECRFGIRMPVSVGNTSLCVIGKLSACTINVTYRIAGKFCGELNLAVWWSIYIRSKKDLSAQEFHGLFTVSKFGK